MFLPSALDGGQKILQNAASVGIIFVTHKPYFQLRERNTHNSEFPCLSAITTDHQTNKLLRLIGGLQNILQLEIFVY